MFTFHIYVTHHYSTSATDLYIAYLNRQEVIVTQLLSHAYMFPTHPELNMSGPRDSLYIERSYEFASSRL